MATRRETMHYSGALIGERLKDGKVWIWAEQSDETLTALLTDLVEMVALLRAAPEEGEAHHDDLRNLKVHAEALEAENKLLKRTLARIREGAAFSYRKFESSGRKLTYDQIAEIAAEAIKWEQGQDLGLTRKADNG